MKYKSLIGSQKVTVGLGKGFYYQIWYNHKDIIVDTQKAIEDAIKLGIIEEVKPRVEYFIYNKDLGNYHHKSFESLKDAEKVLISEPIHSYNHEIIKFIEEL